MELSLGWKVGLAIAIGVASATAVVTSYRHYSNLVDAKADLSAQVATLKSDVIREQTRADAYERTIDKWDEAAQVQARALDDNTKAQREAGKYARNLTDVLSRHDLGGLAAKKPALIERRINTGTADAFRLLEHSSQGAADAGGAAAAAGGAAAAGPDTH